MSKSHRLCRKKNRETWIRTESVPEPSFETVLLHWLKPSTRFKNKHRWNKATAYEQIGQLLKKHEIAGSYIGLGASHIPEIYDALRFSVRGKVINCEHDSTVIPKLSEYTQLICDVHEKNIFELREGDIFNPETYSDQKYAILDLDLMEFMESKNHLLQEKLSKITNMIDTCASQRFCLILWSLYGMKVMSEDKYNNYIRPSISQELSKKYSLIDKHYMKYCDSHIPIKVDVFVARKRRNNANNVGSTRREE